MNGWAIIAACFAYRVLVAASLAGAPSDHRVQRNGRW